MKSSIYIFLAFGVVACGTVRPVLGTDSTKVEVRTETRLVHDTAYIEIPVIQEKVSTLDTTSHLENKYAKSEAIVSGGVLTHSLATKPVREPVAVEIKEIIRDSIVYRDQVRTETVEVEKELTPWQALKMKTGGLFIGLSLAFILFLIIYFLFHLKSFKL